MHPKKPLPGVSVHAGFPNPSTDLLARELDLNTLLIQHPTSTFFMRIDSDNWQALNLERGDIALVDRAITPVTNDLVIYWNQQTFSIAPLQALPAKSTCWGVVTSIIRQFRSGSRWQKS